MKEKRTVAAVLLAVICLGIAAFFIGKIVRQELAYRKGDDTYDRIGQLVEGKEETPDGGAADDDVPPSATSAIEDETSSEVQADTGANVPMIDFEALGKLSGNMKAWLYLPDSVINYPVAQCEDNAYYLDHLADGTRNINGCLFLDCKNAEDFSDENSIIYGHHMKNGSMFGSLDRYESQDYYDAHPVIYLVTERDKYRIEIFSAYTTSKDSDAYTLRFSTKEEYQNWLIERIRKSDVETDVTPTTADRVITLSTCAYSFQGARFVVHGKFV